MNKKKLWREILDYVLTLAVVALLVYLLNTFVLINARIPSESMENTIMKGDQIFGNRLAYRDSVPERYDIIIFRYPDDREQYFIKRVIGLPGDTVHIRNGHVYINEEVYPLDDSYTPEPQLAEYNGEELVFDVPDDHYFVMGDNRNHSNDSRYWDNHFVPMDDILGKAMLRYWPITKIRTY